VTVPNFFYFRPVLDCLWSELVLAGFAQVNDLGRVRIALVAKAFKDYVHLEVILKYLAFVLPDIFRGQFHFPSNYIVTVLLEGCVEHYSAN